MRKIQSEFFILSLLLFFLLVGCTASPNREPHVPEQVETTQESSVKSEQSNDIEILFTSDMHCGILQGFGVVGLQQVRQTLRKKGIETILVDDGDAIQGDVIGTLTKGSAILDLMNDLQYDIAIPGNHEFDYGMENFLSLAEKAKFPYISCNFNKQGELVFDPYVIKEVNGKRLAFIGVTTPRTLTSSAPTNFMDDKGQLIYGFLQDGTGELLFHTVQKYIDEVREKGADYVFLITHMGNEEVVYPYNFQTLIENISGADFILDGHSHDTGQVTMNDKEGKPVLRLACGTKLQAIGYVRLSPDEGEISSGLYTWSNKASAADLFGLENELSEPTADILADLEKTLKIEVGKSSFDLVADDPEKTDEHGAPVRLVRSQECNLGDFAADAIRASTGSDIAIMNGGGLRAGIKAGIVTYGDIVNVFPFSNQICVSELSGQQILDALEWGARSLPGQTGSFLHPSGLTYEINAQIPSSCTVGTDGLFSSAEGEYRVRNVMVNGEPLDLAKTYTVSGLDFIIKNHGSGFGMMGEENVILNEVKLDNQALIEYIQNTLCGVIDERYADPYGDGRIVIIH